MFENYTYENLLEEVLNNAPEDIDTRPGSIFYDAVSGFLIRVAKFYTDLPLVFSLSQVDTATGEYLDSKASEYGVVRHEAVTAKYKAFFSGTIPEENERFFYNGLYFKFRKNEVGYYFEAEEAGTEYNNIESGTAAVPVDTVSGLEIAGFGTIIEYGTTPEDDESLRRRLKDKISGTGENGNKQHYKIWCESIDGVGKAKIFPLWNGPNTVKAVLIDLNGLPCNADIVNEVQQYIDPNSLGLGEGVAPIGAHFTAAAALEEYINISVDVEPAEGCDIDSAVKSMRTAISNYFKTLVMNSSDNEEITIKVSEIGAAIVNIPEVTDYRNLGIFGSSPSSESNIVIDPLSVPVLMNLAAGVIK